MRIVVAGYGSRGDVEPCAALARELQRRGHDVRIAFPPNMLDLAEAADLAAVAFGPDSRDAMNPGADLMRRLAPELQNPFAVLPKIIEHVGHIKAAKTATLKSLAEGADVMVAGFNEQGPAANIADFYGIPLVVLHFFPARILSSWAVWANISKQTDLAQRAVLGLPEPDGTGPAPLDIQAYHEICLPGTAAEWADPGQRIFSGALTLGLPTATDAEVLTWIAAGSAPIYFGFGSTPMPFAEMLSLISAACTRLGKRGLVCSGPNDVSAQPIRDDMKVVRTVNHSAILPACCAAVHHGGAGTVAAGLRAGIPMLVLWSWMDQPVWAAGIERLEVGLGQHISTTTLDSMVAALRQILTQSHLIRAREVAAQMTTPAHSVEYAAGLVEDVGRGRPPLPAPNL